MEDKARFAERHGRRRGIGIRILRMLQEGFAAVGYAECGFPVELHSGRQDLSEAEESKSVHQSSSCRDRPAR